jgi:hypothetical protein
LGTSDDVVTIGNGFDGVKENGFVCNLGHGYIIPKVQAVVKSFVHNFLSNNNMVFVNAELG